MRKKETEEQAIERRKRMYGCDGKCVGDAVWDEERQEYIQGGLCGGIDTCDETRVGEFIGSCLAVLFVTIGIPLAGIIGIIYLIYSLLNL